MKNVKIMNFYAFKNPLNIRKNLLFLEFLKSQNLRFRSMITSMRAESFLLVAT